VPGLTGEYLRRAFLAWTCAGCGPDAVVGAGTIFSTARVRIDGNAYVGPQCNIGWAHIERDALLASGVHVPSGPDTHGTARRDIPMRDQPGVPRQVRIGEGAWIGNAAVIMADVGRHAIVGAGAVVTKAIPDFAVAAGVPARVLRSRRDPPEAAS
jgi:acetyltransferase-like isoleucine patch superfamily enzyme